MNKKSAVSAAAALVSLYPKEIDMNQEFSHGKGGAKNFVGERRTKNVLSWTVENPTNQDMVIAIGSTKNSILEGERAEDTLKYIKATHFIKDGVIFTDAAGNKATAVSNDSERTINRVINYFAESPTRLTGINLRSARIDGTADVSNFQAPFQTAWANPFYEQSNQILSLRKFQNGTTFSKEFIEVDFINENFPVIISPENFFLITVKKGTVLDISINVGAQNSKSQRLYRAIRAADKVIGGVATECCD